MKKYNLKYNCKVGENCKENWELLEAADDKNYFFHLSSFPSCYVILECYKEPDLDTIRSAAEICRSHTKYRNLKNLKVDYCPCSNLTKGDKVGEVIFKSKRKVKKIKLI